VSRGLHWSRQDYDDYCRKHSLRPSNLEPATSVVEVPKPKGRQPNKTEAEFGLILEAMKRRGDIVDYFYEGITLRWGGGMRYTADFSVIIEDASIKLIETKGGYIWPKDLIRFKGCREEWKTYFDFEMHQKKEGSWTRLF